MDYDDAYANAPYIPGADAYPDQWLSASETWATAQSEAGTRQQNIPYGDSARQVFDLFKPVGNVKGLVVFVHGGYWLKFDRTYWFHLAAGAVARGWAVAVPSYDLCPNVRISQITRQIASAISTAGRMVEGSIILAGHSAGGHLVSRMLEPGILDADIAERLQRILPISPVADLRPLMQTSMNSDLRIDSREAEQESPVLILNRLDVPVTVWVGSDERPAFLDQARWLANAWQCDLVEDPGKNHFNVIEGLTKPESPLMTSLLS